LPDVGVHVLQVLAQRGVQSTAMSLLMPNCPLRTSADIREHKQLFEMHQRDFQISVVTYGHRYPQWALQMDEQQCGSWLFGQQFLVQSQHLAASYCPTGAIWWVRVQPFLAQQAFYGDPYHLALIESNRGMDIDDEEDMRQADILVRGLNGHYGVSPLEPVTVPPFEEAAT
jgi:CMP-N-acetylneuraminic acid synthetase